MSIGLLDAARAERFRVSLNNDPEFGLVGRDMSLNLVIGVGGEQRLLGIREGQLMAITQFVPMDHSADIYITGDGEFWNNLLSPLPPPRSQNLYAAAHAGNCTVAGNTELYNAYFPAINRMIDVMREAHNGS